MIILSTAAKGNGRATLRPILIVNMKEWDWEMKKCEKELEGDRARPWPGRRAIQMKLEAYEKCGFFLVPKCTSTGHIL